MHSQVPTFNTLLPAVLKAQLEAGHIVYHTDNAMVTTIYGLTLHHCILLMVVLLRFSQH